MFWVIIFSASIGSNADKFEPKVAMGPCETIKQCSALAALSISGLNEKNPDKDFRASISNYPDIVRHPGEAFYDLRMLAALAGSPFPMDKQ